MSASLPFDGAGDEWDEAADEAIAEPESAVDERYVADQRSAAAQWFDHLRSVLADAGKVAEARRATGGGR